MVTNKSDETKAKTVFDNSHCIVDLFIFYKRKSIMEAYLI